MPDGDRDEYRRRRGVIRWLILGACVVVLVDVGAGILTLVASHQTDKARNQVSAGLAYAQDTSSFMQDVLDAETAQRGYMLTGEYSYLAPVPVAVRSGTTLLRAIRRDSRSDPVLHRDYVRLNTLVNERVKDLEKTLELYHAGHRAAALAIVKTNRGNAETQQLRTVTAAMVARSNALVAQQRHDSRVSQVWADRAQIAAYIASAALLVLMVLMIRYYLISEAAGRESRLAQIEAERLNRAKTGFLSRVSHELRTPLNAILGFGQLLERDLIEPGELETLDQMLTAGRHLLAIVDDLLDLSRIEVNELRLSLEPVQVTEAIAEAKSLTSHQAVNAAVGVRQRPVNVDLYVRADRQRLLQVLLNLLSNAVKYNRRGGNVVISAGMADGGRVRIEVADTGAGIPSESLGRLFTPFERLDAASRGIEGTGLGLAVARGLIESMGGRLDIASEEGVGTTVWFELPMSSAAELAAPRRSQATDAAAAAGQAREPKLRPAISVLYIEDNPSNVRLVEKIFALSSDLGLSVGREGAAGLALARERHPDVILLDLHLPDMPGEQVLSALLADPETADIPVIIVSADASPAQAKRLRGRGAAGYLTKPFDIDQLLTAVRAGGTPQVATDHEEVSDTLLDMSMVGSLHMLAANPAVGQGQIGEMLATFRHDAEGMLRSIHEAVGEANLAVAASEAHRLAGGAGAVGAGRFRTVCKELEHQAREGNEAQSRELDARLDLLLEQTWAALASEFAHELSDVRVTAEHPPAG